MTGRRVAGIACFGVVAIVVTLWISVGEGLVERWYIERLDASDAETRLAAAQRLEEMESTLAIHRLLVPIRAGERGDVSRQQELLVAMGEFTLPLLLEAFEDGEVFVRLRLLSIFREMGPVAKPAISRLLQVEHEYLFAPTIEALATMGEPGHLALFELLAHERMQFRVHAANALGNLRPDFESALLNIATATDMGGLHSRRWKLQNIKRSWWIRDAQDLPTNSRGGVFYR